MFRIHIHFAHYYENACLLAVQNYAHKRTQQRTKPTVRQRRNRLWISRLCLDDDDDVDGAAGAAHGAQSTLIGTMMNGERWQCARIQSLLRRVRLAWNYSFDCVALSGARARVNGERANTHVLGGICSAYYFVSVL